MLKIMTVTGAIAADDAGTTLSHEHVLIDLWSLFPSYNNILDDEQLAVDELKRLSASGGRTVVDCTSDGIGRRPAALRRISIESGVQIVMGCGWYREAVYPPYIHSLNADRLADMIVRDLSVGAEGTDVRAGIIGEIGTERRWITPGQERVFRAAARAQRRTGASIWTHTTHFGELALEQVQLLTEEGVPPSRIVVSHLGDRHDFRALRCVAETGVFLGIDNVGNNVAEGYGPDELHVRNIRKLLAEGFVNQVLLSTDVASKSRLLAYGGTGYGYLLRDFLPLLRRAGVSEDQIRQMTVANPARALAYPTGG